MTDEQKPTRITSSLQRTFIGVVIAFVITAIGAMVYVAWLSPAMQFVQFFLGGPQKLPPPERIERYTKDNTPFTELVTVGIIAEIIVEGSDSGVLRIDDGNGTDSVSALEAVYSKEALADMVVVDTTDYYELESTTVDFNGRSITIGDEVEVFHYQKSAHQWAYYIKKL